MTGDRPLLGIALMLGFCMLAPLGDALAKLLGPSVPLLLLIFIRMAVQTALLFPLSLGYLRHSPRHWALIALRGALHIAGIGMMFSALIYLPLADAVAIAFVMPFIMLALGHIFLGEEVGWRRALAAFVGFVGTLLVIQPSFTEAGWPALLPLGVALDFALFMLVTRLIARDIPSIPLQALSGGFATLLLLPALYAALAWDMMTVPIMSAGTLWLLAAVGVTGTLAHLLMTGSLRFAPASTLAPMQYLEIPIATFFGWLIFNELPGKLASLGIAITIGAGLYIIAREARQQAAAKTHAAE